MAWWNDDDTHALHPGRWKTQAVAHRGCRIGRAERPQVLCLGLTYWRIAFDVSTASLGRLYSRWLSLRIECGC